VPPGDEGILSSWRDEWMRQWPQARSSRSTRPNVINPIDTGILHFFNQFAQKSWFFDKTIVFISDDPFVGGGLATTFFWWAWFRKTETRTRDREIVLSGLAVSFVALFVARALALVLPFRIRPYLIPELSFRPIAEAPYKELIHWSSFPSDHAVLYFSLATCIFLISRKAGVLSFCHAFFVICLPRVYLGEHYPTDILAGAILGIAIASVCLSVSLRTLLARLPLHLLAQSPGAFYTCFYLCTFLFATNFNSIRKMTFYAWHLLKFTIHLAG
jgi:undecaprenyl-diphosphatase